MNSYKFFQIRLKAWSSPACANLDLETSSTIRNLFTIDKSHFHEYEDLT